MYLASFSESNEFCAKEVSSPTSSVRLENGYGHANFGAEEAASQTSGIAVERPESLGQRASKLEQRLVDSAAALCDDTQRLQAGMSDLAPLLRRLHAAASPLRVDVRDLAKCVLAQRKRLAADQELNEFLSQVVAVLEAAGAMLDLKQIETCGIEQKMKSFSWLYEALDARLVECRSHVTAAQAELKAIRIEAEERAAKRAAQNPKPKAAEKRTPARTNLGGSSRGLARKRALKKQDSLNSSPSSSMTPIAGKDIFEQEDECALGGEQSQQFRYPNSAASKEQSPALLAQRLSLSPAKPESKSRERFRSNSTPEIELPKPSWSTLHAETWSHQQQQRRRTVTSTLPAESKSRIAPTPSEQHQPSSASAASPTPMSSLVSSTLHSPMVPHSPSPPWSPLSGPASPPLRNRSGSPDFGERSKTGFRPQLASSKLPEIPEPGMSSPEVSPRMSSPKTSPRHFGQQNASGVHPKSGEAFKRTAEVLEIMSAALTHCGSTPILAASTKHLQALLRRLPLLGFEVASIPRAAESLSSLIKDSSSVARISIVVTSCEDVWKDLAQQWTSSQSIATMDSEGFALLSSVSQGFCHLVTLSQMV